MKFESRYEGEWGDSTELFVVDTGDWKSERPVVKTNKCCGCGTCYLFCPTGCSKDMGGYFAADLEYCKGCGICARLCPVSAITMVRDV